MSHLLWALLAVALLLAGATLLAIGTVLLTIGLAGLALLRRRRAKARDRDQGGAR